MSDDVRLDHAAKGKSAVIPKEWLERKISVEEAEAAHPGFRDDDKWEALKAEMKAGDEVWTFSWTANSWRDLAGRAGVALVRGDTPITTIITMMT